MSHHFVYPCARSLFKIFNVENATGTAVTFLKVSRVTQVGFCSSSKLISASENVNDKKLSELLIKELNIEKSIALYLLNRNQKSKNQTEDIIKHNIGVIKEINWPIKDVISNPKVLIQSEGHLNHKLHCLKEFGFRPTALTIKNVFSYSKLIKMSLEQLKNRHLIRSGNIYDHMLNCLDCPQSVKDSIRILFINDQLHQYSILTIRKSILLQYLSWRLKMSISDILSMLEKYFSLGNRSLQQLMTCIDCLLMDFEFSPSKLKSNGFLLLLNAKNLKKMLQDVPTLGGIPLKEIAHKCPRILSMPAAGLLEIDKILIQHKITKEQIENCPAIFTLKAQTVQERLNKLKEIVEFEVMLAFSRLLHLVYYQQKAIERLEFLKAIGYECISLDLLICSNSNFKSTIQTDDSVQIIRFRGKETVQYLSVLFGKSVAEVQQKLFTHPKHSKKSSFNCKHVISFLQSQGFSLATIFKNLHIILYDVNDVKTTLEVLSNTEETSEFRDSWKTSPYSLQFVVYKLEREFKFSGNGVWSENTSHWSKDSASQTPASDKVSHVVERNSEQQNEISEKLSVKSFLGIE